MQTQYQAHGQEPNQDTIRMIGRAHSRVHIPIGWVITLPFLMVGITSCLEITSLEENVTTPDPLTRSRSHSPY